jgi:RNA polymerase sigma-70 factor (ECF subfamily)
MTAGRLQDELLIDKCQLGDSRAINDLLTKYQHMAYMYALKMTKDIDDAADVVSEGFMRIHRAIDRFQANSTFSTWMFKILRNCFLDQKKKRRVNVVASLDAPFESQDATYYLQPVDESESAFDTSCRAEFSRVVDGVLDLLPAHQRELLLMYHVNEMTYVEIAKQLDTPAGTIKSRLHRARSNLHGLVRSDPILFDRISSM